VVVIASWLVAWTVGTLLTRTKNSRQKPDNKLKKQRSSLLLRGSRSNALGRVPAELNAVFPPWNAVLQYSSNPSNP
jgi:hypothetical protein